MKTILSFRTSEKNKLRLLEKADRLGVTVSDLLDSLLISDLEGTKLDSTDIEFLIGQSRKALFMRRRLLESYRLILKIKEKMKRKQKCGNEINELFELIANSFHQQKSHGEG